MKATALKTVKGTAIHYVGPSKSILVLDDATILLPFEFITFYYVAFHSIPFDFHLTIFYSVLV